MYCNRKGLYSLVNANHNDNDNNDNNNINNSNNAYYIKVYHLCFSAVDHYLYRLKFFRNLQLTVIEEKRRGGCGTGKNVRKSEKTCKTHGPLYKNLNH